MRKQPAAEHLPEHGSHDFCPELAANVDSGQAKHPVEPVLFAKVPAWHLEETTSTVRSVSQIC